jgi:hypothetical protein
VGAWAQVWADTHQQAFGALWAKATGLPTSITDKAAADSTAKVVPINPTIISAEQGVANAFSKAGLIPSDPGARRRRRPGGVRVAAGHTDQAASDGGR